MPASRGAEARAPPTSTTSGLSRQTMVAMTSPMRLPAAWVSRAASGSPARSSARTSRPEVASKPRDRYFEDVTAGDVLEAVRDLDAHDLAVDVVQVDDGWSLGLGEGLVSAQRFGSLAHVVEEVRTSGRRAGVWLAPFVVGADTTLAREHPDWLAGSAGWERTPRWRVSTRTGWRDRRAGTGGSASWASTSPIRGSGNCSSTRCAAS